MLIRNRGLELPVFSWWTPVAWTGGQMQAIAESGKERFVRRVSLQVAGATSLKAALKESDDAFNRVAEYVGVGVVEHTWGLSRRRPPSSFVRKYGWRLRTEPDDIVPKGYHLVAEVTNIAPLVEPDPQLSDAIIEKINDFYDDDAIPGPKQTNMLISQIGFHRDSQQTVCGDIMDIDSYLKY